MHTLNMDLFQIDATGILQEKKQMKFTNNKSRVNYSICSKNKKHAIMYRPSQEVIGPFFHIIGNCTFFCSSKKN